MIISESELRQMERDARGLKYVSIETAKLRELVRCYRDAHPEIAEDESESPAQTSEVPSAVDYLGISRKRPTDD